MTLASSPSNFLRCSLTTHVVFKGQANYKLALCYLREFCVYSLFHSCLPSRFAAFRSAAFGQGFLYFRCRPSALQHAKQTRDSGDSLLSLATLIHRFVNACEHLPLLKGFYLCSVAHGSVMSLGCTSCVHRVLVCFVHELSLL